MKHSFKIFNSEFFEKSIGYKVTKLKCTCFQMNMITLSPSIFSVSGNIKFKTVLLGPSSFLNKGTRDSISPFLSSPLKIKSSQYLEFSEFRLDFHLRPTLSEILKTFGEVMVPWLPPDLSSLLWMVVNIHLKNGTWH
ncbi:hypothetical protein BpHYR1_039689 [Brachionus plicatilis]|uniref:Uncharacterized protein n=1 Tax=Brachionus plicatilis TaxID=10195 RepID=A0A3M7QDK7_BRAPC|nr:hypothetical protein BpHYR1_039689 [Brachionus plicatilis]